MSNFDNDNSIRLKAAQEQGIPKKFLNSENKNTIPEIVSLIHGGKTLFDLYTIFEKLLPQDLIILYAKYKKNTLADINNFYNSLKIDKISDINELDLLIKEWDKNFVLLVEKERDDYEKILEIQEQMGKYEPLQYTTIKVDSSILFTEMEFKNNIPQTQDGYEIFDLSVPNKFIPYIRWKTNMIDIENKELIKIYKGETEEQMPDFSKILGTTNSKESLNTFYFNVFKGEINVTRESFIKANYNLDSNLLKIKIPIENNGEWEKNKILTRITDVLPLKIKKINEKSIAGELYIFDINANLLILSHMVLNDELFRNYLFVKEMANTSITSTKNTLKMFFHSTEGVNENDEPNSSVSFYISQILAKGGEIFTTNSGEKIKLSQGFPYLQVKITSADSLEIADAFVKIFVRLLSRYKEEFENIEKLYLSYIPEFLDYKIVEIVKKIGKDADTKISKLKQTAPDLFIADYARKCLCQFQPIPIPDDEIVAWQNKKFMFRGELKEREVLKFPPNNPRWNFVCPDDKYPFPGVKVNKLSNKNLYPGLPCCFVNEQMTSEKSNYGKIFGKRKEELDEEEEEEEREEREEGEEEREEREEGEEEGEGERDGESREEVKTDLHTIKTDKIVGIGRYGEVPNSISELMGYNMKRKGVPRTLNSFLHCVSIAAEDKNYFQAKDKEKYVSLIKETVISKINPSLLKQELYDFTEQEIMNKIRSDFFDPLIFYRAIEETYKINIFVFGPSSDESKRLREKEESIGTMLSPRCKLFTARSPRKDRSSICIYRTMGSESDLLTYPQCELLVSVNEENEEEKRLFNSSTLFRAFNSINKTISWELISDNGKVDIVGRQNLYSQIDYYTLFQKSAKGQYIDEYGKMRGLYFNDDMMVIFLPSQPQNLERKTQIVRTDYRNVLKILPNPVAVSKKGDVVDGLWYSILDLAYGIYVPIKEINKFEYDLPIGPSNPLGENGENKIGRIIKMKRDLDFLIQTIKWLYLLSKIPLSVFFTKYITTDIKIGDTSQIYNFSNIGRKFPEVNSFEEGLNEMNKRVPTMFRNNKIYLYSEKLRRGIEYIISMYIKEYVKSDTPIPKAIRRKYLTETDFINHEGVALFFSEKELKTWVENLKRHYEIYNKINLSKATNFDPYIYLAPDGHIYLIQNVIEGDLQRALNVSYYWDKYHVNPGFRSPEYDENDVLKYVIYSISPANTLVPYENRAGDSLSYLSILRYNDFSYASMMRLL